MRFCLLFFFLIGSLQAEPLRKILLLIIASDNQPIFLETQKIWRFYMHSDPDHIEAYFIRSDPSLPIPHKIEGDVIWTRNEENYHIGVAKKTINAFRALLPRMAEFDYVFRTNLASFVILPRLLKTLETLPRTGCYYGSTTGPGAVLASGSGFALSSDLIELIVNNQQRILSQKIEPFTDDVLLGYFLIKKGFPRILGERIDILSLEDWFSVRDRIPSDLFHFRIKTEDHLRITDDLFVHRELLRLFYNKDPP